MPARRTSTLAAAVLVAGLLSGVAGCGDDDSSSSGDRPTVDEMAERLTESGDISEDQAECMARAFVDSDISDEGLRAMADSGDVDGLDQADLSADDQAAIEDATQAVIACATDGIEEDLATTTTTTG